MRVIEIVRHRIVDAPVSRVWDVIQPVARLPEWFSGIETAKPLEGEGLGRRQRTAGSWGRHQFEIDQTVTQYDPGRVLGWRHDAERLDGKAAPAMSRQTEFHVHLQPVEERTRVVFTSRQLPSSVFKGLLVRLIAVPRIARMMERSLDRLAGVFTRRPKDGAAA